MKYWSVQPPSQIVVKLLFSAALHRYNRGANKPFECIWAVTCLGREGGGWTLEIQPPGKQQKLQSRSENLLSHPHQKGISLPLKCSHTSHLIGIINQVGSSQSISQSQYESKIVCCRYKSCSPVPETVGFYSSYVPLQTLAVG